MVYQFNRLLNKLFKLKILDTQSSIQHLLNTNDSISRFGDGEMNILMGGSIHFQEYNYDLSKRLKEVLTSPNKKGFKIGIPLAINNVKGYKKASADFWNMNMDTGRMHWFRFCSLNRTYLNASLTRCFYDYEDKTNSKLWFEQIIKIWNQKKILIVEGRNSKLGVNNSLFSNAQTIERIIAPSENAWSIYHSLLAKIKTVANNYDIILVSLGPTASILSYDMVGYCNQIIDIGHLNVEYKSYLAHGGLEFNKTIIDESDYEKQIIVQF